MSINPYPLFAVLSSEKPEQTKEKIKMLIQLYVRDRNQFIARAVVEHVAALLAYPKYIEDVEQRCQLRKLELHWRCLAWIDSSTNEKNQGNY